MARITELANLFHAVASADWQRARALADTIVKAEEKAGHHAAATTLRGALSSTGPKTEGGPSNGASPILLPALPDLLTRLPPAKLELVQLPDAGRERVRALVLEQKHRARLQQHGLLPRSRLFFHGPPGCGKTLTARALGGELGLPVFVVRFDGLVGSYLGQTGLRLREVFRFAETNACVLLIDEIDAVGRRRGKPSDVGELDRVVISLMQQLDLVRPAGVLIAASNIPEELDPALLRRFDFVLEFPAPSRETLRAYAKRQADHRGIKLVNGVRHQLASAKTFAEAEEIVQVEHRRIILRDV
jgi:SpoVK/Ycf46/Vps4 family AAA+-type ATPase